MAGLPCSDETGLGCSNVAGLGCSDQTGIFTYPASLGKVIRYLSDFDMLEYESTILAPSYQVRAMKLEQFSFLNLYVLAKEDIIVSKIIRMEAKDLEDMDFLIGDSDKMLILSIIEEVLQRNDLYPSKREAFKKNLPVFREEYHV